MQFETGSSVPRTEDFRLLIGKGHYTDDYRMPRQAYAIVVRSPHGHADIKSIDKTAALDLPGVVDVLTGADYEADGLGVIAGAAPYKKKDGSPMFRPPRPALTKDRVRFVGQPVAIVIADTLNQARDAAEALDIDYAPLPVVTSTATANDGKSPAIWDECPDNESFFFEKGDKDAAAKAFAGADIVVRERFDITRVTANSMEPRGVLGDYDLGRDGYTLIVGHQRPYVFRQNLAKNLFKMDEHRFTFITGDMGGSFGMKGSIYPEMPLMGWASKRVGRPVKWICERTEAHMADDHGRDNVTEAALALSKDGKILGLETHTNAGIGAYLSFLGHAPSTGNIGGMAGVYTIPAIYSTVTGVFTNSNPISPYRGAGRPEASYIIERMITLAAAELGIDPVELRKRNFIPPSAMPYKTALTFTYDCGEFEAIMDACLERADYKGFEARREEAKARGKLRGIGVSVTVEQAAGPQPETAELRFDPGASLTVLVGTTPHGQGHETIYKQLVCEKLGLAPEDIRVVEGDTDKVSFGTGTGGSRTATIGTSAVYEGVVKVVNKTKKIAAFLLEAEEASIDLDDGIFKVKDSNQTLPFKDAVRAAFTPGKIPPGMEPGLYEIATYDPKKPNFPNGCHVSEVEIDPDTGTIEMVKYTVVDDVGYELNPMCVKGQIHGGIAQGVGQALMEVIKYDENGQLLTGSFMDYAMPRADDLCSFDIEGRPVPTDTNPLGVKGAGECGTVGSLPSIMNAITDALKPLGIKHIDMPASPERVWQAINEAKGA